jgi:hypothetical protein
MLTRPKDRAPIPTTRPPNLARSGSIAKSGLIVFRPERLAEDNWQIRVFFPGVKGEYVIRFETEDAAKEWIAESLAREKARVA